MPQDSFKADSFVADSFQPDAAPKGTTSGIKHGFRTLKGPGPLQPPGPLEGEPTIHVGNLDFYPDEAMGQTSRAIRTMGQAALPAAVGPAIAHPAAAAIAPLIGAPVQWGVQQLGEMLGFPGAGELGGDIAGGMAGYKASKMSPTDILRTGVKVYQGARHPIQTAGKSLASKVLENINGAAKLEDLPLNTPNRSTPKGEQMFNRDQLPLNIQSPPGSPLFNRSAQPLGGSVPPPPAPRVVEDLPLSTPNRYNPPGQKMTPAEAKIAPTPTPTPQQTRPVSTDLTSNVQKLQEMGKTKDDKIAQHLFTQKVSPEDWMAMDEMTKNFHIKNADPKFRALGKGGPLGRSSEQAVRDVHTRLTELWRR